MPISIPRPFVIETCNNPGTSATINLLGVATGPFAAFADMHASGETVSFMITDQIAQSQEFIGTFATGTPDTLTVTTTGLNNSGGTSRLNFTGTCYVAETTPAAVGEYMSSVVLSGAPVSLTNNIIADITSLSLTAGDWDVWGTPNFSISASSNSMAGWINTVSATIPASPNGATIQMTIPFSAGVSGFALGTTRLSLASTTTVYLSAVASFAAGTVDAFGFLGARRRR